MDYRRFGSMALMRAPRWTLSMAFSHLFLVIWQATSSATYKPVAMFMKDTWVTWMHTFAKNAIAPYVPFAQTYLHNNPPTLKMAAHAVATFVLFPFFLAIFGWIERMLFPTFAPKKLTFEERLRYLPILVSALVGAHVLVTFWQMTSTTYGTLAMWVDATYLRVLQSFIEMLAVNVFPYIQNFVESNPLDVNHAVQPITSLLVMSPLLGILLWWRGEFKTRRVLLPDMGSDPAQPTRSLTGGPLT